MSNDYFRFKQFTVRQSRVAMKVGTDGTLLGAWARGGEHILDIGTGTGLIALMMAQRFPLAHVIGIDIDADAATQARENVTASPFASRITIVEADIRTILPSTHHLSSITHHPSPTTHHPFDAIVCNPPFFVDALESPDTQRTLARHASSLLYADLMAAVTRLLADDGEFSLVIPFDCRARLEQEATLAGLFKSRECAVKTTPRKAPRRYLLAFRKHQCELQRSEEVLELSPGERSTWYQALTNDFYL